MTIPIEIETREDRLAFELFDATTLAVGISLGLPGNAVLTFRGLGRRKDPKDPYTVRLELGLGNNASVAEAARWLCSRVKGRASAMRVRGASVEVDPAKVEQALTHA